VPERSELHARPNHRCALQVSQTDGVAAPLEKLLTGSLAFVASRRSEITEAGGRVERPNVVGVLSQLARSEQFFRSADGRFCAQVPVGCGASPNGPVCTSVVPKACCPCRLAFGGGYASRTRFTNDERSVIFARRPVILVGIDDFVKRGDPRDRSGRRIGAVEPFAAFGLQCNVGRLILNSFDEYVESLQDLAMPKLVMIVRPVPIIRATRYKPFTNNGLQRNRRVRRRRRIMPVIRATRRKPLLECNICLDVKM
jgi:hypothetical protein